MLRSGDCVLIGDKPVKAILAEVAQSKIYLGCQEKISAGMSASAIAHFRDISQKEFTAACASDASLIEWIRKVDGQTDESKMLSGKAAENIPGHPE